MSITAKEAYNKLHNKFPKDIIDNMAETPSYYIFGVFSKSSDRIDRCGYDVIDKSTGKIGFMDIIDYANEVDNGNVKEINISEFRRG